MLARVWCMDGTSRRLSDLCLHGRSRRTHTIQAIEGAQVWHAAGDHPHRIHVHPTISTRRLKENMDLLENYPLFAHKLFCNVCIWLVLVGPIFHGL